MDPELNAHLLRHRELTRQRRLEVHYTSHHREAFVIEAEVYRLRFCLANPGVGLACLEHPEREGNVLDPARPSLGIVLTDGAGVRYDTSAAHTPARINIFRHGPHYHDVHVFDLIPTSAAGATLPIRGELVFHAYPDRLFTEVRLHVSGPLAVAEAAVLWHLDPDAFRLWATAGATGPLGQRRSLVPPQLEAGAWVGIGGGQRPAVGWILSAPEGTATLRLEHDDAGLRLLQGLDLGGTSPAAWAGGEVPALGCRVCLEPTSALEPLGPLAEAEASPLGPDRFHVGRGGRFLGYDGRRGHYTIAPEGPRNFARGETFHFYDHPEDYDILPLTIQNDGRPRALYIKHMDRRLGRVEAGIITDHEGQALPLLVQGSKNFCGEHEEPFYDPGDPAYAESYFPLVLEPEQRLRLRSYHARQNWGSHPLKQISSLQAWMPYYQMSVGVTETTCYVPFRFGGHPGIWIADLRGVSGEMWSSQPQFDNVGGHRFFHYRTADGEHFPRYLRSRFQLISPNMCRWGMDYVTEGGEAEVSLDIFEFPQTDQTRDFVHLRVDFRGELAIPRPAENLFLLSLDTTTQGLRYATLGYWDQDGRLAQCPADPSGSLPVGAPLAREAPFIGLYGCTPESGQRGNNAIMVRRHAGRMHGADIGPLAVSARAQPGGNLLLGLTLPGEVARFGPGDFLDLDLVVMPYGTVHGGPEVPLEERLRYGVSAPTVVATRGTVLEPFPARVRVDRSEEAEFVLSGGYSTMAVLVEGFADYWPPVLEALRTTGWERVDLTHGDPEGHHSYLTQDDRFGFVLLIGTDGSPLSLRVHRGR